MKKVLIAYDSRTGNTQKMAEYIAEGIRFGGCEPEVKSLGALKNEQALLGYDAFIFGCPTYHRDMTQSMKTFLFLAQKAQLSGKVGGSSHLIVIYNIKLYGVNYNYLVLLWYCKKLYMVVCQNWFRLHVSLSIITVFALLKPAVSQINQKFLRLQKSCDIRYIRDDITTLPFW